MADDVLTVEELCEALAEAVETYEKRRRLKEHPLVLVATLEVADDDDAVHEALDEWIDDAAEEVRDAVKQLGKADDEPAKKKH